MAATSDSDPLWLEGLRTMLVLRCTMHCTMHCAMHCTMHHVPFTIWTWQVVID